MKGNVQILLLLALLVSAAAYTEEEETMEERKQRIARKYLRERMDITYSEEVVPEDRSLAAEILESDGLEEAEVEFERQQPGAQVPPVVRQPPPRMANNNWLLSESDEAEDSYTDPYTQRKDEPDRSDWTEWGAEWGAGQEESSYFGTGRDSAFNWRDDAASAEQADQYDAYRRSREYDPRDTFRQQPGGQRVSPGMSDPFRRNSYNPSFNQNEQRYTYPAQSGTRTEMFPGSRRQRTDNPYYRYPYPARQQQQEQQEQRTQRSAGVPYGNPYQEIYRQRRDQQEQSDPYEDYRRQDSFRQWKQNQPKPFDPTGDDAYLEEIMPGTRR